MLEKGLQHVANNMYFGRLRNLVVQSESLWVDSDTGSQLRSDANWGLVGAGGSKHSPTQ